MPIAAWSKKPVAIVILSAGVKCLRAQIPDLYLDFRVNVR